MFAVVGGMLCKSDKPSINKLITPKSMPPNGIGWYASATSGYAWCSGYLHPEVGRKHQKAARVPYKSFNQQREVHKRGK